MTDEREIDRFIVNDIRIGEHRRAIDPKKVEALAKSIEDIGLQTPITVWTAGHDGAGYSAVHLVAGLHRLEAYKKLGFKLIEAFKTSGGELDRDLWQIDENLVRADLTELERADHLKRRKEFIKAKEKLGGRIPPTKPQHEKGFAAAAEDKIGMSKRRINEAIRRAEKIAPDVQEAIKDMPAADVGVELDALASLSQYPAPMVADSQQTQAVRRVKSGASKNFREAKAFILGDVVDADDKARRTAVRKRMRESEVERKARAAKKCAVDAEEEAEYTGQDRKEKRIDKFGTAIMLIGQWARFLDDMDLPCLDDPEVAQEAVDALKTARRQLGKVILRVQDTNHLGGTP